MMSKLVLVAYLERKKKITIPKKSTKEEHDYLTQQFLHIFDLELSVKPQQVTFQRFDPEWDEYIDLEADEGLQNRDKLKVVVTPCPSNVVPSSYLSLSPRHDQSTSAEKATKVEVYACKLYSHIHVHLKTYTPINHARTCIQAFMHLYKEHACILL